MGGCRAIGGVGLGILYASHPLTGHDLGHSEAINRHRPQEALNDVLA